MLTATNLFLQYGDRILFNKVNLTIGNNDKVGLVGRNGAGKSTLMRILAGLQMPDDGKVSRPGSSTLNFLHQDIEIEKTKTVLEEALTAFSHLKDLEQEIEDTTQLLSDRTDYESTAYLELVQQLADVEERFRMLGGDQIQAKTELVLKGLGFVKEDFEKTIGTFSGGWQMRVELTKMLLKQPDFLFLDEPTNHLDIESIIWLEGYLSQYPGAVVVISHDKRFLDNICNRTIEIESGSVYDYKAAYSKYLVLKLDRMEKQEAAFRNQQRVIAQKERTITRFMAKASKTKMAQSMQKQLDKLERVEVDATDTTTMNLRFPPAPRSGQVVATLKGISKFYGPKKVLENIDFKIDRGDRIAFVGQNGQGKTTLARIIVDELQASNGQIELGHNVQIGYYAQDQAEALRSNLTLLENLEQEAPPELQPRLRAILGAFMFSGEDVHKKVSVLSGGERARLALAALLLKPFNLLVLDEPTNHLDMLSKEVLKKAIQEYDGTLITVSHDRDFLADMSNRTIEFRDHQLFEYLGDINFFLQKRALDDMRQVEMRDKQKNHQLAANSVSAAQIKFDHQERKRRQRALQNAEKEIERLESKMADMEKIMAATDFYSSDKAQQVMVDYGHLKTKLNTAMENWELAQAEWEEVGE